MVFNPPIVKQFTRAHYLCATTGNCDAAKIKDLQAHFQNEKKDGELHEFVKGIKKSYPQFVERAEQGRCPEIIDPRSDPHADPLPFNRQGCEFLEGVVRPK